MLKRFINQMLISSDKLTIVCFTPKPDLDSKYKVFYDYNKGLLDIHYSEDCYTSDLENIKEISIINNVKITHVGCIDLLPTVINNNVEYIQGELVVKNICQYLISDNKLKKSGLVVSDNNLVIAFNHSDIKGYNNPSSEDSIEEYIDNIKDYCEFINKYNIIYAKLLDNNKVKLVNIYFCPFDNQKYSCTDTSIAGMTEEFALNDARVLANFIDVLQKEFPEIQFYTTLEDRDTTNYNEWIHYEMVPRTVSSRFFHNNVKYSETYGKNWHTTVDFKLEYSSIDLPTLLARRDLYTVYEFLMKVRYFNVDINLGRSESDEIQCAVYWDRNELPEEYSIVTSQDNTGYAVVNYPFTGRILYCNIQYKPRPVTQVIEAICKLIEEIPEPTKVLTISSKTLDEDLTYKPNINITTEVIDHITKPNEKLNGLIL